MQKKVRGGGRANQRTSIYATTEVKRSSRHDVLASLRATQIVASKPVLPAELFAVILDYLPPDDLIRCARVSRRLQEMVYDNERWIKRLKAMGVWNEIDAKQKPDEPIRRKPGSRPNLVPNGSSHNTARQRSSSITIFDAGIEEEKLRYSQAIPVLRSGSINPADGFDHLANSLGHNLDFRQLRDLSKPLTAFEDIRSIRGRARQEYGRIYGPLNPLYVDLTTPSRSTEALALRLYQQPEDQALVLANLRTFSTADFSYGWPERIERLSATISSFASGVLREFQQAYDSQNAESMKRFAAVSFTLDDGTAVTEAFINSHPLILGTQKLANPLDCVDGVAHGHVDLGPSHRFFERLAVILSEQAALINYIFPVSVDVLLQFLTQVNDHTVKDFVVAVLDETHRAGRETFLKAVPGVFEQAVACATSIQPTAASSRGLKETSRQIFVHSFKSHIDPYLAEELDFFKSTANEEVDTWEKQLHDQEAQTESFFMSNVSRQAAKRDFLSTFRKVVMMPVNVLPAFPLVTSKTTAPLPSDAIVKTASRPSTPSLNGNTFPARSSTPTGEAPTTELAAKAAIMNSRLEGIKSLFSIEVALSLVHHAKSAIERIAVIPRHSKDFTKEAKAQCEAIFVALLYILGQRHIKPGFDKAVGHLTQYKPKQVKEFRAQKDNTAPPAVEPLVTFLELVNVGDLIQQMVDVFYVQELVATNLTDRDDFINPAGKEKKRFEQMLDERVAAGMGIGIDVLMDEVEYICATTQTATDYNPGADKAGNAAGHTMTGIVDIGPSTTATLVVDTIKSHTSMLVGSTDKQMLDVFFQEVGQRLFGVICKHIKRQRISADGAIKLISDINHYSAFITSLRQKPLLPFFSALRELSQIYLIDCTAPTSNASSNSSKSKAKAATGKNPAAKELATIIADTDRYRGIFGAEEVYEFAERRADWFSVKADVERAMYGVGCTLM